VWPEWTSAYSAEDVQHHAKLKPHRRKEKENERADYSPTTESNMRWRYTEPLQPTGPWTGMSADPPRCTAGEAKKKNLSDAVLEEFGATIADCREPANLAIACGPALHAGQAGNFL